MDLLSSLKVRVVPRTLCFKQPAGTSRGVYRERKLWYVVITSADPSRRFCGIGECAPLFDLSADYVPDYESRLRGFCDNLARTGSIDLEALREYPSMLFGLETALRSAQAAAGGGDFLRLWDTPFARGEQPVRTNGLVWMGTFEEMQRRMDEKLASGFSCVKLKIGAIDFENELELLRRLRLRYAAADVELRLDANGAFAPQEALQKLELLSRFDIHSIEQPIRQGQWAEMARLCRETPIPIALDEELIGVNVLHRKRELLDTIRPQYIILKPTLHGGCHGAEEWINEALARRIPFWITSALESNVGLNAIAQWTAHRHEKISQNLADEPLRKEILSLAQGLGTGMLFTHNFQATQLTMEGENLWLGNRKEREFRRALHDFSEEWQNAEPTMTVHTSGSTGKPTAMTVEKKRMAASARLTCDTLGLHRGDTALLCLPLDYIAGKMMAVRSLVQGLKLTAVAPSSHPFATLTYAPHFVAMTPMQLHETLQVPREKALLWRVGCLIIGGGSILPRLEAALQNFPGKAWSTYGMTETLSHIALRRIDGKARSDAYQPMPGVGISLAADGCLVVDAPHVCEHPLHTNDLAELLSDGSFQIIGRKDNVVCSGGLKLHLEDLEERLSGLNVPFLLTAVPDEQLGEALTLLYEDATAHVNEIKAFVAERLSRYERPRHYFRIAQIPLTETGKPARAEARRIAQSLK